VTLVVTLAGVIAVGVPAYRAISRIVTDVHDVAEYTRLRMALETAGSKDFDPDKFLRDLATERAAQAAPPVDPAAKVAQLETELAACQARPRVNVNYGVRK